MEKKLLVYIPLSQLNLIKQLKIGKYIKKSYFSNFAYFYKIANDFY